MEKPVLDSCLRGNGGGFVVRTYANPTVTPET